jgi:hypothetical protein
MQGQRLPCAYMARNHDCSVVWAMNCVLLQVQLCQNRRVFTVSDTHYIDEFAFLISQHEFNKRIQFSESMMYKHGHHTHAASTVSTTADNGQTGEMNAKELKVPSKY